MVDKNNIEFKDGDIIDIHQTVNGHNLFVVHIKESATNKEYSASYYKGGQNYQYDVMGLLYNSEPFDDTNTVEIIGNMKN
jgi:hypothetical protein